MINSLLFGVTLCTDPSHPLCIAKFLDVISRFNHSRNSLITSVPEVTVVFDAIPSNKGR
ncbi:unnamed protein product, partial [Rotaria magnacalcarata]